MLFREKEEKMKIVAVADIHGLYPKLIIPECELLLIAGDLCGRSTWDLIQQFDQWLGTLKQCKDIIVTCGNHDKLFEKDPGFARSFITNAHYLQDDGIEIGGYKIWASPWTVKFYDWAFMKRDNNLKKYWDLIPEDTDILVTHSPPKLILDKNMEGDNCGSQTLNERVQMVNPYYHIFGHIHEAYGRKRVGNTQFINASVVNRSYELVNKPVELIL